MKIGIGRVRIKGIWRMWADVEKEGLKGEKTGSDSRKKATEEEGGTNGVRKEKKDEKSFV